LTGQSERYYKISYSSEAIDQLLAALYIESHASMGVPNQGDASTGSSLARLAQLGSVPRQQNKNLIRGRLRSEKQMNNGRRRSRQHMALGGQSPAAPGNGTAHPTATDSVNICTNERADGERQWQCLLFSDAGKGKPWHKFGTRVLPVL
jgi:hypothetical protein